MKSFSLASLRVRITILVLIAVLPAWGMILHTFSEQRRLTISAIQRNTLAVAEFAAREDEQFLQSTREILLTLAHFLSLYGDAPLECTFFFKELLGQYRNYVNFGAAWPDGTVFCSAQPGATPASFRSYPWFQQALQNREFTLGDYHDDQFLSRPLLVMALPVNRFLSRTKAVVFAVIDVDSLNPFNFAIEIPFPKGSSLELVVSGGQVLARRPVDGNADPKSSPDTPLLQSADPKKATVIERPGPDGTPYLYAVAPVNSGLRRNRVYVILRVPKKTAFAEANRILFINLILLGLVAAVALSAAWWGGDYFILRQVKVLAETSKRLAAGDLNARTGLPYGKGELGLLARAFDDMARSLQAHEKERQSAAEKLQESQIQLRQLSMHLVTVREDERTRIAREIHDNIGQNLTALKLDLAWLTNHLDDQHMTIEQKLQAMSQLIDESISTIHRLSAELRPGVLDDLGLASAIEWQAEEFEERTGIKCEIFSNVETTLLSREQTTALFRIYQETLTNVARHAQASEVKVSLDKIAGKVILEVVDNGRGITEEQINNPYSYGIIGMRERVHPWGGNVEIRGLPGEGTTVRVTIPVVAQERTERHD